jgi:cytochrome P450
VSATTTTAELNYDPYSVEQAHHPWDLFRRLRDEAPLYYNPEHDFYALSRRDDVEAALVNRAVFISGRGSSFNVLKADMEIPPGTVIFEDPPTHGIHRSLMSRMFTPRSVSALEPKVRELVAGILEKHEGAKTFDFVDDLGAIIPTRVIGMLMGIPETDQFDVRDHFESQRTEGRQDDLTHLSGEFFADYIDWRAKNPSDDVVTHLINVEFEDADGTTRKLTREELLAYVNIVTAAGNETTGYLIGWTGYLLAEHPEQRQILRDDPSLVTNAVEEILRIEPPALQIARYVNSDTELHGQTVPKGSIMALLAGSANHDERHVEDPERFDVTRAPGQIFSLGFGAHFCIGQAVARLEGRVVLDEVVKRFPDWEVDHDKAEFRHDDPDMRGWRHLPVTFN